MTDSRYNPEEVCRLLWAMRDGRLAPNDAERLGAMLLKDERVRKQYVEYMFLSGSLEWDGSDRENVGTENNLTKNADDAGLAIDGAAAEASGHIIRETSESFPSLDISPLSTPHSPLFTPFVGGPVFSYMVASVVLCVMLLSAWAYKITHDDYQLANDPKSVPTSVDPRYDLVAQITGMKDCRWAEQSQGNYVVAGVSLGRKFNLAAGLLEITYKTGAKVILEGPCEYTVDSRASGYLTQGKLVARVEKRGERSAGLAALAASAKPQAANPQPLTSPLSTLHSPLFTISTPTAVVTDLGTEFGMEVELDGSTTSHVFRGSVRMQVVGDKQNLILRANDSASVEKNAAEGQPSIARLNLSDTPGFVREMPSSRTIGSASAYAELVMSLDPAAYFRMERPDGRRGDDFVENYATGKHHGILRLGDEYGGTPFRQGRFGDSLWLRGPEVEDRAIVPDYPKAENDRLTVAAWVMASGRPGWAMIAANWGTPREGHEEIDNAGQFHIGLYRNDGDLCARIVQRNGKWIQVREGADNPLPTGVWQHVAMVVDEGVLRLYRNGVEVASTPCDGLLAQPPIDALGIGCRLDTTGKKAPRGTRGYHYWQGRIDELAVFNETLPAETIRRLCLGKKVNGQTEAASVGKGESPMDGP